MTSMIHFLKMLTPEASAQISTSSKVNHHLDSKDPLLSSKDDDSGNFDSCLKSCVHRHASHKMASSTSYSSEENASSATEENVSADTTEEIPVEVQIMQEIAIQSLPDQEIQLDLSVIDISVEPQTDGETDATETTEDSPANAAPSLESSMVEIVDASSKQNLFSITADTDVQEVTSTPVANESSTQNIPPADTQPTTSTSALNPIAENSQTDAATETGNEDSQQSEEINTQTTEEIQNMGKDVITEAASTEADEASSGVVLQAEIDKSRRGKSNAISRGKGKKIGLTAEKHSAKTHTRENTNLNLSESGKKYPNIFEGSESGVAHKILSHLKQDEAALSGTSYAENHAMDDLIQSWNQRNPELDSLISERIGLDGIQDLTSIDQLRNNSWKNANASDSVKTEIMPKTALKDVPEIINNVLNSSNLVLPKRIEIPLKTPEGSIINLYLQEANGHIRAQISTNDRLVMESLHREVALLKDTPFENNIKWTPPQFERQESQKEQTGYRQPQQQSRQQTRQQDEETSKFEEAINFFDALRKEES